MLTSIRGIAAASLSAGLVLSAAPAFASENTSEVVTTNEAADLAAISDELIAADRAVSAASTATTPVAITAGLERANEPVDADKVNALGEESPFSFSGNIAFTTDYRFRGITLTDSGFAVQGGFDLSHASGFYIGTWASNLDEDTVGYGSAELDIYGGWSGTLVDGLSANVGVISYLYPDAPAGDFDYVEFLASLTGSLGPASITAGVAYAPDQDSLDFGGGQRDNFYVYGKASVGIPNTPVTINGSLGFTDGVLTYTADSKAFDWSLSADWALGPVTLSAAYIGVEGDVIGDPFEIFTDDAFVVTLKSSF